MTSQSFASRAMKKTTKSVESLSEREGGHPQALLQGQADGFGEETLVTGHSAMTSQSFASRAMKKTTKSVESLSEREGGHPQALIQGQADGLGEETLVTGHSAMTSQ